MINRINLILRAKNITARQFAEEIGIQPSGMSHIMGGRNNPSLDFVTKVIRRYPEIDANWLLLGRGEMYTAESGRVRSENTDVEPQAAEPRVEHTEPATLFSDVEEIEKEVVAPPQPVVERDTEDEEPHGMSASEPMGYEPTYIAVPPEPKPASVADRGRRLVRMLFIYSDNTFHEFRPAESI